MARKRGGGKKADIVRDTGERLSPEEEARLTAELEAYEGSDAVYEYFAEEEEGAEDLPPPGLEDALHALEAWSDEGRAAQLYDTQKVDRRYIGVAPAGLDDMVAMWRDALEVEARVDLAEGLWNSNIFEARLAAARLLFQARLRPDDRAWRLIQGWIREMDCPALTDAVTKTAAKRVQADPARVVQVEGWLSEPSDQLRSAAFRVTLPFAKLRHPKPEELAVQTRVLGWIEVHGGMSGPELRLAISAWLRAQSRHAPKMLEDWARANAENISSPIRRELGKLLNVDLMLHGGKAQDGTRAAADDDDGEDDFDDGYFDDDEFDDRHED